MTPEEPKRYVDCGQPAVYCLDSPEPVCAACFSRVTEEWRAGQMKIRAEVPGFEEIFNDLRAKRIFLVRRPIQ